jgi:eukaryotic-like serine/threonine-protein kinase
MIDSERWERIQARFHEAAELPSDEQRAYLERCCPDDPALVAEVLELLAEDARADSLLDQDLGRLAERALQDEPGGALPPQIGPYRLERVLGEGGMGVVHLASRADLQSRVAIKVLRDAWLSPARHERFVSEQRLLAQLNHPSIARIYDADTLPNGTPWFAMEYVEGLPITDYCATHETSLTRRLELFRAVCEAVLHAHQQAVIHRDLKPSNILVTSDEQVKLLDFGIAKQLENAGVAVHQTRTELRLMTPAYASPEQVRGLPLGVHTDVYSLGVILYELLAGRPPFDFTGRTPTEVERVVTEQEPERPSIATRKTGVLPKRSPGARAASGASWADLDVLCLTAMQKDPARRYRTVDSLIRDIDHYLREEPLEARPDTVGYRLRKFVRRNWRAVSAAAAVIAVVVGLVTFYTVRLARARTAAVAEAERARRIQGFMNGLFQGGDEAAGPSDSLRVRTIVERGVREARALAGDPAVQADLYETLGSIYENLGEFDRADSLLRTALDVRRAHFAANHPDVASSLVGLAVLRVEQSEYDEAEKLAREGLAIARRNARSDPAGLARATEALGFVFEGRGTYDEAIATLTEAVRLDSLAKLPATDVGETMTQLANCHFYAGHYEISDSLNRRVLAIDREHYGPRHPHVASDLVNLGALQTEWGHHPEAERYYREALEIYRGWYGDDHFETAAALTMVGRALIAQDRLTEATALLERALVIREHVYGPNHPNVASTVNELARVALQQHRYDDAERGFRRMIDIYRSVYDDKHYLIGLAYANLAGVYTERKQFDEAERLFHEALRRYAETLPPDHLYIGIAHLKLGRTLLRARRYPEAQQESLAGYQIVAKQSDPPANWLNNGRQDLAEEYDALRQPAQAQKYRAELAAANVAEAAKK